MMPTIEIGSLLFDGIDQIDLTGPFEVLSRMPGARHRFYAKSLDPVRDVMGLRLLPDATLGEAPRFDVLHVPGGPGQEALMQDKAAYAGCARTPHKRERSFPSAPGPYYSVVLGFFMDVAQLRTGHPMISSHFSEQSRSTSVWSLTEIGFLPQA